MSKPLMVHCIYRPTPGNDARLLELVKQHWGVIHKAGLTTDTPATVYRATDKKSGKVYFIEIFSWKDESSPAVAHQMPEVMKIWEPMGPMIEGERGPELAVLDPVAIV